MTRYLLFFLLLLEVGCIKTNAQTRLSLGECIDYALQHHPSVLIYENNRAIAREASRQSVASYLPQITGTANATDNLALQSSVLPAGIVSAEPVKVQFGTQYNTVAAVEFSQTIYDQSKIIGIKAGEPYEEMVRLQQQQNREKLIYNTATAYFQVLIYREQLAILRSNQHQYEEMVATLTYQHQKGVVLENSVDRVQVNLNTTHYQIEDARTQEQLALNTLKNTMGMPFETNLLVADSIQAALFNEIPQGQPLALDGLLDVQINRKEIALQEINVKMQRAGFLPKLSVGGKYGWQALSNEFDDAFSGWNEFSYVGMSLSLPIFSGLNRASKVQEEKLKLENDQHEFTLRQQSLKLSYENAQTSLQSAYSSFLSNRDNLSLAKKLLDVTEYQYQQGVVSLTDYLNDDTAYKTAQSNYIKSLYNLMINQLEYQMSKGTLLEFIDTIK